MSSPLILLDTCTLLWLADDQSRLSQSVRALIAKNSSGLVVSAITAFELGVKHARRQLELPLEPAIWFERALALHGLVEIPITGRIAARSTALPWHHRDPCDRILVATAEIYDCVLLTPDPLIATYSEARIAW